MTQAQAMAILKTGKNVFLTGPAGSGKTHVLNLYIKYLKEKNIKVGITASTGIAATHMGGITIHSWSGMGINEDLADEDIQALLDRAYMRKRIEDTKVLIIDEISMLHHYRLDLVNRILKAFNKTDEPFGGIQVVLCGDFFQLPPINKQGETIGDFAFRSSAWKEGKFIICYLDENHRQKEEISKKILNEIRKGEVSKKTRDLLLQKRETSKDYAPTRLFTHNIDVDNINDEELSSMNEYEYTYEMTGKGNPALVLALKKSCLAPQILRLKKGARVMCVKNNFDAGYVNGTLGVVVSCGPNVDPVIRTSDGRLVTIERATWVIDDMGKSLAEIHQHPLRLAWAITVHKSQGMSLDWVEVDLSRSFEPGMGYVALSRARSIEGLRVLGMNETALLVHPEVREYDSQLKQLSDKAESVLQYTDSNEIERAHAEFLSKSAPLHRLLKKKKKTSYKRRKVEHIEY